jgi:hypothetical protein
VKNTFQKFRCYLFVIALIVVGIQNTNAQLYFNNSFSVSNGIYSASGIGSNHYIGFRYNHFFERGKYFFEATFGISSLKSRLLDSVAGFQLFDSNKLQAYEFTLAYDPNPSGSFPYIISGVAGINQGGQSQFAYLIGVGKIIPLNRFLSTNRLGLRYNIRDHIFRQEINNDSFISHNLVFTLGIQYFF